MKRRNITANGPINSVWKEVTLMSGENILFHRENRRTNKKKNEKEKEEI